AVSDVVATLRVLADPTRGDALMRLLTGSRWRIGPRDIEALGRLARMRAAEVADTTEPVSGAGPAGPGVTGAESTGPRVTGAEPAGDADVVEPDEVDPRGIVDALDALPDEPGWFSPEGERRLRTVAAELRALRLRSAQPLVDLIVDVIRTLGLDIEVAARTGD